jgi:hypothetical protein
MLGFYQAKTGSSQVALGLPEMLRGLAPGISVRHGLPTSPKNCSEIRFADWQVFQAFPERFRVLRARLARAACARSAFRSALVNFPFLSRAISFEILLFVAICFVHDSTTLALPVAYVNHSLCGTLRQKESVQSLQVLQRRS